MSSKSYGLRAAMGALALIAMLNVTSAAALSSGHFGNVYQNTEAVKVTLSRTDGRSANLLDRDGKLLATVSKNTKSVVDFGLREPGYYSIQAETGTAIRLVVAVNPIYRVAGESRLGLDNSMTTLVSSTNFSNVASLLKIVGPGWVRERMFWFQAEPARDQYNWNTTSDSAIAALAGKGIKISEVFHATPTWARSDQNTKRVPDDLRDIYNFGKSLATHHKGRVQAWEAWNEPDLSFFDDSASEMAAYQKAAYLGFHAADVTTRVLSPSIGVAPGAFAEHLLQNGMGPYFDIWNYHSYGVTTIDYDAPTRYAARTDAHRALLARYGVEGRPFWVTELGIPSGTTGSPSAERRFAQASFLSRALPSSVIAGNERSFWFVMNYYAFANSDWGLFEPDKNTPLPGLAALSTATYALGQAVYLGQLDGLPAEVRAMVFDRGNGTQTLALWRDSVGETPVTLPLQWGTVQDAVDYLGGSIRGTGASVAVTVTNGTKYLILPSGTLDGQLTNPPAAAPTTTVPAPSPLVARLRISNVQVQRSDDSFQLVANTQYGLTAEVYNFSASPVSVTVSLDGSAAPYLNMQVTYLTAQPGERIQVPLTLKLPSGYAGGTLRMVVGNSSVTSTDAVLNLRPVS